MEERRLSILERNGVKVLSPENIFISEEVDLSRIKGCIIYPGCKIFGKDTLILEGSELGREGGVTLEDCQLGRNVKFKGGYAKRSTFLEGVEIGLGAHIREGCLLEEGSRVAHTVGLKQTILFPFVTLGSLINFCDCLMAGGTDPKNHSEVGSSYIHFNFTPQGDKATPSLVGDVPRGVMLDQPPIFLGGQGGMVGPLRIEFGVVVAAGVILRKDVLKPNVVVMGEKTVQRQVSFIKGYYQGIRRIFELNILYVANLIALRNWYVKTRLSMCQEGDMGLLTTHALEKIDMGIEERIRRLEEVVDRLPYSLKIEAELKGDITKSYAKTVLAEWDNVKSELLDYKRVLGDLGILDQLKDELLGCKFDQYIPFVKGLKDKTKASGVAYLRSVVEEVKRRVFHKHIKMDPVNWS